MPRAHYTVVTSRIIQKQRARFDKLCGREKDKEKAVILARIVDDLDRVLEDIRKISGQEK